MKSNKACATIKIRIDEVWTMNHFEIQEYAQYNEHQKYFLYGDDEEAFLSHIITKQPDFYQVSNYLSPLLFVY